MKHVVLPVGILGGHVPLIPPAIAAPAATTSPSNSLLPQDCLTHLCDLVHFVNVDSNRSRLRSATTRAGTTVRIRTKLVDPAFSVAGH